MATTPGSAEVLVHTDGACKGNPGPGGWGAVLEYGGATKELFGGAPETTNNRMELTAVIEALRALNRSCRVRIVTDSQYVRDLWEALDRELVSHQVVWEWVRGHQGHPGNERADQLANRGVESITL
jgi:ribonuclease HI